MKVLPVILCGGSGKRVWPESRESLPKQFIPLVGDVSTFRIVLDAVDDDAFMPPVVISNHAYRFLVGETLLEAGREARVVLEPEGRGSGPAAIVAAEVASRTAPGVVVALLAGDHAIGDKAAFVASCREAALVADRGHVVSMGTAPTNPTTCHGFVLPGAPIEGGGAMSVERFEEAADRECARRRTGEGWLCHSGNLLFRADAMLAEMATLAPETLAAASDALAHAREDLDFTVLDADSFARATRGSVSAILGRTAKAAVVRADVGWSDVGDWGAVWELSDKDADGNSVKGHGRISHARNVLVRSPDHLTAVIGVDDVTVVTTHDAVLVVGRDHGNEVRELVERLRAEGHRQALEHVRSYRPWGYYQCVDLGARYQVKRIVVRPGARLSLQKHYHRAEHWVVARGVAEVTRGPEVLLVHENESVFLPMGTVHRLANPGKIDLELIEVQTGSYLGEDDIVRIEDAYNRT